MGKPLLAVGWDVGGWHGDNQAVAVAQLASEPPSRAMWCGKPKAFSLAALEHLSLRQLIQVAWAAFRTRTFQEFEVVVAVDAPFGFPENFCKLLNGQSLRLPSCSSEMIQNELAYRYCDRRVFTHCDSKRPLSASFDKLGNNTTVAMMLVRRWSRRHRLPMLPFQQRSRRGAIIEVYPALAKTSKGVVYPRLRRLLPPGRETNSHARDAAICALLALAFARGGDTVLPRLVRPVSGHPEIGREGWIYYPPIRWLKDGP